MRTIQKSALVPFSNHKMYNLVNDIPAYPHFLPWCSHAAITSQSELEMTASITIAHSSLHQTFTTKNSLQPDKTITINLIDGPFSHLRGVWQFQELQPEASKVILQLEFDFSSRILALTMGPVFNHIGNTLVDAFSKRAKQIYG